MQYIKLFEDFMGVSPKYYKKTNKKELSQNFWKWFGNSVMKDDNSNPVIMYHGSDHLHNIKDFKSDKGYSFFTTSTMEASRYVTLKDEVDKYIGSFYIKAEKPFDANNMSDHEKEEVSLIIKNNLMEFYHTLPDYGLREYTEDYREELSDDEILNPSDELLFEYLMYSIAVSCDNYILLETVEIQEWIRSKGYDSFFTIESGDGINIAVYNSNQIKPTNAFR